VGVILLSFTPILSFPPQGGKEKLRTKYFLPNKFFPERERIKERVKNLEPRIDEGRQQMKEA